MNQAYCEHCPARGYCLRRPSFCRLAAAPRNETDLGHIRERSRPAGGRPAEYPPLSQQAANLAASLVRAATNRFRTVPEAERDRRLALCHACPRYDPCPGRCTACGCIASLKAALESEGGRCPDGKW